MTTVIMEDIMEIIFILQNKAMKLLVCIPQLYLQQTCLFRTVDHLLCLKTQLPHTTTPRRY